jgi:hypothetical protein
MRLVFASVAMVVAAGCSLLVDTGELAGGTADAGGALADGSTIGDGGTDAGPPSTDTDAEAGVNVLSERGLVGAWFFDDGTSRDLTGRGSNAVLQGDAKIVAMDGRGQALQTSGNGLLLISAFDGEAFPVSGTLSLWIRYTTMRTEDQVCFLDQWNDKRDHIFLRKPDGDAVGALQLAFQEQEVYEYASYFELGPNTWAHVVTTWDNQEREGRLVVDGKDIGPDNYLGTTFKPSGQQMRFGFGLNGFIDDIRLYNRVLSYEEIQALR